MSFKNFPETLRLKVFDTGELVGAGGLTLAKPIDLAAIVIAISKNGAHAGTEKLRGKLFYDKAMTKLAATGTWSRLSDIPSLGSYCIGWLRLSFSGEQLAANTAYWLGIETTGYTRDADSFYLAYALDAGIGQSGNPAAAAMAIYGHRWI